LSSSPSPRKGGVRPKFEDGIDANRDAESLELVAIGSE
jgi:hypothetical protein